MVLRFLLGFVASFVLAGSAHAEFEWKEKDWVKQLCGEFRNT